MTSIREISIARITDPKDMKICEPSDKEFKNNPLKKTLWPIITHGGRTNKIRKTALKKNNKKFKREIEFIKKNS